MKSASHVNKPRVSRMLVSPVVLAGDEKSVDRHMQLPRPVQFTHRLGGGGGNNNPPPIYPHPELCQVKLLTQNKHLVGGNPLV